MWIENLFGGVNKDNTLYRKVTNSAVYIVETLDRKDVAFIGLDRVGLLFEKDAFKGFYSPIGGGVIFPNILPGHLSQGLDAAFSNGSIWVYYELGAQVPSMQQNLEFVLDRIKIKLIRSSSGREECFEFFDDELTSP